MRQIDDVVRLGRVQRIEADRIVLERGETRTGPDVLHVDCTALGLNNAPATPIFQPGRIVLQQVRHLSPCFNAALIGFIEAHRDDDADKNRLCPPNPYASSIEDWPRMISRTWRTEGAVAERARPLGVGGQEPAQPAGRASRPCGRAIMQAAVKRYVTHVGTAIERMSNWDGSGLRTDATGGPARDAHAAA